MALLGHSSNSFGKLYTISSFCNILDFLKQYTEFQFPHSCKHMLPLEVSCLFG